MATEVLHEQTMDLRPVTITGTGAESGAIDDPPSPKTTPRRPSFKRIMTEPMSQLRKRKWVSSCHNSPPPDPKRNMASRSSPGVDDDNEALLGTEDDTSSSSAQDRRRKSSAERILDSIRTIFRRDSHDSVRYIAKKTMNERRNTTDGDPSLERLTIEGMRPLPNVDQYFDEVGESGPSNYYERPGWKKFQNANGAAPQDEGKLDRRHSFHSSQQSACCGWTRKSADDTRVRHGYRFRGDGRRYASEPGVSATLNAWLDYAFLRGIRERSMKRAGKQPFPRMPLSDETLIPLHDKTLLQNPTVIIVPAVVKDPPMPTASYGGIRIVTPSPSKDALLSRPTTSSTTSSGSNDFSTTPISLHAQEWQKDRNKHTILSSKWHYPHREARLRRRTSFKRTLTGRPDTRTHHLRTGTPVGTISPAAYIPTGTSSHNLTLPRSPTVRAEGSKPNTPGKDADGDGGDRDVRWITPQKHGKKQILTENMMFSMSPLASCEDVADGKIEVGEGELSFDKEKRREWVDCGVWVEGVGGKGDEE